METQLATDPNRFTQALFDGLPRRYDRLAEVLSFGQNRRWRRAMVDRIVRSRPAIASSTSPPAPPVLPSSSPTRPMHSITGIDLTASDAARGPHPRRGARRQVACRARSPATPRCCRSPTQSFDALTFTYLLRYVARPRGHVCESSHASSSRARRWPASTSPCRPTRSGGGPGGCYTRLLLPVGGLPRRCRLGRGRPLPRPEHQRPLRRHPVSDTSQAWENAGMVGVGSRAMSLGGGLVMWGTKAGGTAT